MTLIAIRSSASISANNCKSSSSGSFLNEHCYLKRLLERISFPVKGSPSFLCSDDWWQSHCSSAAADHVVYLSTCRLKLSKEPRNQHRGMAVWVPQSSWNLDLRFSRTRCPCLWIASRCGSTIYGINMTAGIIQQRATVITGQILNFSATVKKQ